MVDMGFQDDVLKILDAIPAMKEFTAGGGSGAAAASAAAARPVKRVQTIMFSATLDGVASVSRKYMDRPLTVDVVERDGEKASLDVAHLVLQCPWQVRAVTVGDLIRVYGRASSGGKTLIFVDTKRDCDELAASPVLAGVGAKAMHGDVAQNQREAILAAFRTGSLRCIVATGE